MKLKFACKNVHKKGRYCTVFLWYFLHKIAKQDKNKLHIFAFVEGDNVVLELLILLHPRKGPFLPKRLIDTCTYWEPMSVQTRPNSTFQLLKSLQLVLTSISKINLDTGIASAK